MRNLDPHVHVLRLTWGCVPAWSDRHSSHTHTVYQDLQWRASMLQNHQDREVRYHIYAPNLSNRVPSNKVPVCYLQSEIESVDSSTCMPDAQYRHVFKKCVIVEMMKSSVRTWLLSMLCKVAIVFWGVCTFLSFSVTAFFALIHIKREKKRAAGEGTAVYSCYNISEDRK